MSYRPKAIPSEDFEDLASQGRSAPVPLWVVEELSTDFNALGLYSRIASAAVVEQDERPAGAEITPELRVTASKEWAEALFEGVFSKSMDKLLAIGAITKLATYRSGKVRLQVEAYPPEVRKVMDSYRRPDGRLVVAFA